MALDIIKDIVEAEAKAEEMIKNAEAEAASLKAEAEKRSAAILAEARQKSKAELNAAADVAVGESRNAVAEIARQAELDCRKVKEAASLKKEEAIKAVIGKVVGTNGNS